MERPQVRTFKHLGHVLPLFLMTLVVIFSLGGEVSVGISVVGFGATYFTHSKRLEMASMFSMCVTAFFLEVWMAFRAYTMFEHGLYYSFLVLHVFVAIILGCLTMSLYHPLILKTPRLAQVFERIVLSTIPYPTTSLLLWAIISFTGLENSGYYLVFTLMGVHYLVGLPLAPSFAASGPRVTRPFEARILTMALLFLPSSYYAVVFSPALSFSHYYHISNVIMLVSLPLLYLSFIGHLKPLWFTGMSQSSQLKWTRRLGHVGAFLFIGCFEYRVIFHSFTAYIHADPPYSYIGVTIFLYSFYIVFTFALPMVSRALTTTPSVSPILRLLIHGFSMFGAVSSSMVLGLPALYYPSPVIGSQALVSFYFRRSALDWLLFVACVEGGVVWFMKKTYLFLTFSFSSSWPIWGEVTLSHLSVFLLVVFFLGLTIPGLLILAQGSSTQSTKFRSVVGTVVCLYALLHALIEWLLFLEKEPMYPAVLIIVTSVLGVTTVKRAYTQGSLNATAAWISVSLFISKLCILIVPVAVVENSEANPLAHLQLEVLFLSLFVFSFMRLTYYHPLVGEKRLSPNGNRNLPLVELLIHILVILLSAQQTDHLQKTFLSHLTGWVQHVDISFYLSGTWWSVVALGFLPLAIYHSHQYRVLYQLSVFANTTACLLLFITPDFMLSLLTAFRTPGGGFQLPVLFAFLLLLLSLSLISSDVLASSRNSAAFLISYGMLGASLGILTLSLALPHLPLPTLALLTAVSAGALASLLVGIPMISKPGELSIAKSLTKIYPMFFVIFFVNFPIIVTFSLTAVDSTETALDFLPRLFTTLSSAYVLTFLSVSYFLSSNEKSPIHRVWFSVPLGNGSLFAAILLSIATLFQLDLPSHSYALLSPLLLLLRYPSSPSTTSSTTTTTSSNPFISPRRPSSSTFSSTLSLSSSQRYLPVVASSFIYLSFIIITNLFFPESNAGHAVGSGGSLVSGSQFGAMQSGVNWFNVIEWIAFTSSFLPAFALIHFAYYLEPLFKLSWIFTLPLAFSSFAFTHMPSLRLLASICVIGISVGHLQKLDVPQRLSLWD